MYKNSSLKEKFRMVIIVISLSAIFLTVTTVAYEINTMTQKIAKDYVELNTSKIESKISEYIGTEIALTRQLGKSEKLKSWLSDEKDETKKRQAFDVLQNTLELYKAQNSFLVSNESLSIYFMDKGDIYQSFVPKGKLEMTDESDRWYFQTADGEVEYNLNINTDRLYQRYNLWINGKIIDYQGHILGVVGTGLPLEKFVNDTLRGEGSKEMRAMIVDERGHIRLDSTKDYNYEMENKENDKAKDTLSRREVETIVQNFEGLGKDTETLFNKKSKAYISIKRISHTDWYVITAMKPESLYGIADIMQVLGVIGLVMLIIFIGVSLLFKYVFVKPFDLLKQSLILKSENPEHVIFGIDKKDEFGILAKLVDDLTDKLAASVPVGMFVLERDGSFSYANQYFLKQFECDGKDIFLANPEEYFVKKEEYQKIMAFIHHEIEMFGETVELTTKTGRNFWAEIRLKKAPVKIGEYHYEGILINIQAQKEHEAKLLELATRDQLTGIYNRRYFDQVVAEEINRCMRYGGVLSLAIFDLDHFKRVNDSYGHDIGDKVLKQTALIAGKLIRTSDTLARWGGEEFAILMPGTTEKGAQKVAEKVRVHLSNYNHALVGTVTASFGVGERREGESYKDWFKRVDKALFSAKQKGRNRTELAESNDNCEEITEELKWQESYNSNNAYLDFQHFILFKLANELIKRAYNDDNIEEVIEFYQTVVEHTKRHFKDEEMLLNRLGFPESELKHHQNEHQDLLDRLAEAEQKLREGNYTLKELFVFLVDEVVVEHMLKEDVKYYNYTRDNPTRRQLSDLLEESEKGESEV